VRDVLAAYFDKKKRLTEQAKEKQAALASKMAALGDMVLPKAETPSSPAASSRPPVPPAAKVAPDPLN